MLTPMVTSEISSSIVVNLSGTIYCVFAMGWRVQIQARRKIIYLFVGLIDWPQVPRDGALNSLVKNGIRQIDAVLLTHDHADAMMGMDDLRDFTHHTGERVRKSPHPPPQVLPIKYSIDFQSILLIQKSMPIFLRGRDLESVARVFPYLVDTKKVSLIPPPLPSAPIQLFIICPFEVNRIWLCSWSKIYYYRRCFTIRGELLNEKSFYSLYAS